MYWIWSRYVTRHGCSYIVPTATVKYENRHMLNIITRSSFWHIQCFEWKNIVFKHALIGSTSRFWYYWSSFMQITRPWPPDGRFSHNLITLKTKGNVNIKLWDLCESLIVYILLSTFQWIHMALAVNIPDVRGFIAWIEVSWLKPLTMLTWDAMWLKQLSI